MTEIMRCCEFCDAEQYGWDGLQRHLERGWCKKHEQMTPDKARIYVGLSISRYLEGKEKEYQEMEAYDRKHNLGAYSY